MKVTILAESLTSGGAERRACTIAVRMAKKGHRVKLITFYDDNHFAWLLENAGVEHLLISARSRLSRVFRLRKALQEESPHAVLAFLTSASLAAKLASLPSRSWGLVVSEGQSDLPGENRKVHWDRKAHRYADYIITNSHTNRLILEHFYPEIRKHIITIYNAVDLSIFKPRPEFQKSSILKVVIAAYISQKKNTMRLIEAVDLLHNTDILSGMEFHWYGSAPQATYFRDCQESIASKKLKNIIYFHAPVKNIEQIYHQADAVLLPSLREGLPNAICEALACGLPVIMSSICDAGNLVRNGYNGFLFDPTSSESLAGTITKFKKLSLQQRQEMGYRSREIAEKWFSAEVIVDRYLQVLKAASDGSPLALRHWPPEVPQTALEFIKSAT